MHNKFILAALAVGLMGCQAASAEFVTWKEEVKLNDGRVVVVTQKKRCQGAYTGQNYAKCIAREAWLTIRLPEFSQEDIVWHEKLDPLVVNVHEGRLYIVGWPHTGAEFMIYGKPQPPYLGFVWMQGKWEKIPFSQIPDAIYSTNMLIESIPPEGTELLTLDKKDGPTVNGKQTYPNFLRRIVPEFRY